MKDIKKEPSVTVVVSVFNFADSVAELYQSTIQSMEKTGKTVELLFVDDASTDTTCQILSNIAEKDKRVRVLRMRSQFGELAALEAGLKHSQGEQIVFISGRVRINPAELPKLLEALDAGKDFVMAWRYPRRDSLLNRWISSFFNRLVSKLCKIKLNDVNSGVFATYRHVLEKVTIYGDLYNFMPVMAAQQGYQLGEVKIEQLPGSFRVSKYPREYMQRFLDIISVFFLTRYSKKPIHFMGLLGTVFFLAGLVIEIYLFIYRILQIGPIAGRPLLILGALLLVIGIQMISIGLLGEMIIFTHAGDIEEYNIEEIING